MFGVVFEAIGRKVEERLVFSRFWPKNHELTPWEFGQNFKFAQTFCIGKKSREIMFGVVFQVIGSKVEESWFSSRFWPKSMD